MESRYEVLAARTRHEFPRFSVKKRKESWFMRAVFWLLAKVLRVRTFGQFTTTIGSTIYVADFWDAYNDQQKYEILRHEKMHLRQWHEWPLGRWAWPVNHLLYAVAYLLLPIPFFFTLRARFEREGYLQNLLVIHERRGRISEAEMKAEAERLVEIFAGPFYAWMWTKGRTRSWAMESMRRINAGEIKNVADRVP